MKRGNKLLERHRMILPEHRARMLQYDRTTAYLERPVLTEDKMEEMQRVIGEAA